MPKTVTIGLKVDTEFIKLLNANVLFSGLREKDEMQPIDQLALIALMEMRGAITAQTYAATLPVWRNSITIVPELRKVEEEGSI